MFIMLLVINFIIAFVVAMIVALLFQNPVDKILHRLVNEEIYIAWRKYITFAIYVVGISGGVRVWDLEKYLTPKSEGGIVLQLTQDRWVFEVYRTLVETLQSDAWMLLLFFLFAMVAFVVVKAIELRRPATIPKPETEQGK